jgi:tetratricopeptide (TPR) repeat protein
VLVKGGSTVGAWPLLPYLGLNPFILGDYYKAVYNKIPLSSQDKNSAKVFIDNMVMDRKFTEKVPEALSKTGAQIIVEPRMFNQKLWQAVENAYFARKQKRDKDANEYFREAIKWANRTVNHMTWFNLAKRDNAEKQKEYGGIIYYPWGSVYANNDNPIHTAILKYPLLNEMGIAMWGLVTAYYELGDYKTAKYWIGRMIDDVSLHQIPDVVRAEGGGQTNIIQGYWNALVLWEDAAGGSLRDAKIGQLYKEVLETKGLTSAKPKIVDISKKVYGSADSQKR